jgi:DMSO/TMAO reductase YedYZ molybdopterin-dependent catalytic subunit
MTSAAVEPAVSGRSPSRHRSAGALLGLLSGAVALGVAQLVAGVVGGTSSPIIAVGSAAIDLAPPGLKSFAIRTFGTSDKTALVLGILVVLAVAAVILGVASIRRPRVGVIGLCVLGAAGLAASLTRPTATLAYALPSLAGTVAGLFAFRTLRRAAGWPDLSSAPAQVAAAEPIGLDRRSFIFSGVVAAIAAGLSGFAGEYLVQRSLAGASREAVTIPRPASAAPPVPPGADLDVAGVGPFLTPNDRFYRVDTALLTPSVSADSWQLRIHGMVDRDITLTYDELLARPLIERDITLACVSNEVGGTYIGNARWIGARLDDLLAEAGIRPGADQVVSRSADGFTAGSPTAVLTDGRDAMLAVTMNGEPLPLTHGFPVRMVVPGLYGYVSATKWVVDLELTTFEAYDAYWIKRGWAQQAPVKTQSRIDTPGATASLNPGPVAVAGVAWAQHRGIEAVEVRVDDDPWRAAELAAADGADTWRQWLYRWDATSGPHTLEVRATDGTGAVQTAQVAPPAPDGATGYHAIEVDVA